MERSTVAALGVLALASLLQLVVLVVAGLRVRATVHRVTATGGRMAADLADVRRNLSAAAVGLVRAGAAGRNAAMRARTLVVTARRVAWLAAMVRRFGPGPAEAIASVLSMRRQRG